MVRTPASGIRGHEFHSRTINFPWNQIIYIFLFPWFPFFHFFLSFEVYKWMCEYILKVQQYQICNVKETKLFHFSKWLILRVMHKGKTRHIEWLSSFLFNAQSFYWDINYLASDDKYYNKRDTVFLSFWQHFWRTITLTIFDIPAVSTESQVLL